VALAPDKLTLIEGGYFNSSVVGAAWIFGTSTGTTVTTSTALVASPASSTVGQSVTFTATVTNTGGVPGTPTGNVTFFDGATNLGTVALNGPGQASLTTSSLSIATHNISAVYAGDANFSGSTSNTISYVVSPVGSQVITVTTPSPATAGFGSSFTVTATATSG